MKLSAIPVMRGFWEDRVLPAACKNHKKFKQSDTIVYCSLCTGPDATSFADLYGINTRLKNPNHPSAR